MDLSKTNSTLSQHLNADSTVELAMLVGSRANGTPHERSDWDIALQWRRDLSPFETLGHTETLRRRLAAALGVDESLIDLIDLARAGLAMRALVADEGIPLKGEESINWNHFLARTWRELEQYDWEQRHAS